MSNLIIECYSKDGCKLCTDAQEVIGRVNSDIPFQFTVVDIASDVDLNRRYSKHVPTVFINGKKAFKFKVDEAEFRKRIRKEIITQGLLSRRAEKNDVSPS